MPPVAEYRTHSAYLSASLTANFNVSGGILKMAVKKSAIQTRVREAPGQFLWAHVCSRATHGLWRDQ